VVILLLLFYVAFLSGGGKTTPPSTLHHPSTHHPKLTFPKHSPLNPDWKGDGKSVTLAFGGDVHFAGAVGAALAQDPATALGNTISQLFAGAQLRMVNLETAVTDNGTCPQPQDKTFIFDAPPTAITALRSASITLATQANDHAVDCGTEGLTQDLSIAASAKFPIIGVGRDAAQAFAPYRVTINGQRISVIAATQVIASNLVSAWTATSSQPGVASALNPTELVRAVQKARRTSDTVVVYLHWGTEVATCPNPQQEPLAEQLVKAGADIVIGTNAHVLQGSGYLGSAYVDYGLGNFAFYDDTAPETDSGSLIVTAEGRHIVSVAWRPANILAGLPQPLTGPPAAAAVQSWQAARSCTNLAATPSTSLASEAAETIPFTPTTTTTTTTTSTTSSTGSTTTTSTAGGGSGATTTTTSTTVPPTTTTPTDNAG
jgi:poly-gamma-glutamate capsule biosynthesis protein CapA/YwtB (metallophosphatase superfamily)